MEDMKCKAKRTSNNEWVYGYYVEREIGGKTASFIASEKVEETIFNKLHPHDITISTTYKDVVRVKRKSVCKFSGYCDKNGNEMYEHDMVRSDDYPFSDGDEKDNYYGEIWFDGGEFFVVQRKNPKSKVRGISDGVPRSIYGNDARVYELIDVEKLKA